MLKQVQNTQNDDFTDTGMRNYFTADNLGYFLTRYSTEKTDVSVGADKKQLLVDSIIPSDTLSQPVMARLHSLSPRSGFSIWNTAPHQKQTGRTLDQLCPLMP